MEHTIHRLHPFSVERRDVEACQAGVAAAIEHTLHICHFRGVEVGKVDALQSTAIIEHRVYLPHIACVETAESGNARKACAVPKQVLHACYIFSSECRVAIDACIGYTHQTGTTREHFSHILQCVGVGEHAEVEARQACAAHEHLKHRCDTLRDEVVAIIATRSLGGG